METPNDKPDFAELSRQHKQTFTFPSSMGEITLKRISFMDNQRVLAEISIEDKDFAEALDKLADYMKIARDQEAMIKSWEKAGSIGEKPIDFPHEFKEDRNRVRAIVGQYNHRLYGPCFVNPKIKTKEELDVFMDNLDEDERLALVTMLTTLISGLKDIDKNLIMLTIAKDYGIQWSQDLFMDNMTLQQAQLMMAQKQMEAEAAQEILSKIGKG